MFLEGILRLYGIPEYSKCLVVMELKVFKSSVEYYIETAS
jgi:hypothetical protein